MCHAPELGRSVAVVLRHWEKVIQLGHGDHEMRMTEGGSELHVEGPA